MGHLRQTDQARSWIVMVADSFQLISHVMHRGLPVAAGILLFCALSTVYSVVDRTPPFSLVGNLQSRLDPDGTLVIQSKAQSVRRFGCNVEASVFIRDAHGVVWGLPSMRLPPNYQESLNSVFDYRGTIPSGVQVQGSRAYVTVETRCSLAQSLFPIVQQSYATISTE